MEESPPSNVKPVPPSPPPSASTGWSSLRQNLAFRYAGLSSANLVATFFGFTVMLMVVRRFGAVGLGSLALAQTMATYGATVGLWGTDLFAVQRVAARPDLLWSTLDAVRRGRFAASAVAYVAMLAICALVPSIRDVTPLVAVLGLSLFIVSLSPEWLPQAKHRTNVTAVATLSTQVGYLGIAASAILLGAGLMAVAAAKAAADLLVMIGLLVWLRRNFTRDAAGPSSGEARGLARDCAPICATQLLRSLAIGSDVVILGIVISRADLGVYSGASRLFMFMLSLATAYFVIQLPRFAEQGAQSTEALARELRESLGRTVPLAALGVLCAAVLAAPVLTILFGAGFEGAATPLRLLGAAAAVNLVGRHFRQILLVRGRQGTDFRVSVVGTGVHIASKVVLIPALGITGAAVGTLLGESFLMVAHGYAARRELQRAHVVTGSGSVTQDR